MEKQTAEAFAKKGFAIIKSAAKSGAAAISQGVATVRKGYAIKHEADVLSQLKAQGLHPAEHLHAALRKLNYLYLAGYEHELQAVAQQAAKRLECLMIWVADRYDLSDREENQHLLGYSIQAMLILHQLNYQGLECFCRARRMMHEEKADLGARDKMGNDNIFSICATVPPHGLKSAKVL